MTLIKPFRGLRPVEEHAATVAAPPYDVLSSEEAKTMAQDNPLSFLHVSKPEIGLPATVDHYADEVYAKGKENLARLISEGVMRRDEQPCLYLYEQRMRIGEREQVQIGVVAAASVAEYQQGLIKKHELTRADKEQDRSRHLDTLSANSGPVFLTHAQSPAIDRIVSALAKAQPTNDFVALDGIGHRFWVVSDARAIQSLVAAFAALPHLYIADGHHRAASASNVQQQRKAANPQHNGDELYNDFLAVIFPANQLYIMDYNRVVLDLHGLTKDSFLTQVKEKFDVVQTSAPRPSRATEFGMYLGGMWYRLTAKPGTFDPKDPVGSLDVSILQQNLLAPILGILDPRRDKRIDFVGGIRGTAELEKRVHQGAAVAFAMYATSVEQLMAISDADQIMPPKSTWFEPKLRSGLVVRLLD